LVPNADCSVSVTLTLHSAEDLCASRSLQDKTLPPDAQDDDCHSGVATTSNNNKGKSKEEDAVAVAEASVADIQLMKEANAVAEASAADIQLMKEANVARHTKMLHKLLNGTPTGDVGGPSAPPSGKDIGQVHQEKEQHTRYEKFFIFICH